MTAIYAVKVRGDGGAWCYELVTRNRQRAIDAARVVASNLRRDYPLCAPVVVRNPPRAVVDLWSAAWGGIDK